MNIYTDTTFNDYNINVNTEKELFIYEEIMEKFFAILNEMLSRHCKVMQIRFDIRYPVNGTVVPVRQHLYSFCYNLKRALDRKSVKGGHIVDPRLIWVEERIKSEHPHYHFVLLVNGNAIRSYFSVLKLVEHHWMNALNIDQNGLVHFCDGHRNGIIMNRNSIEYQNDVAECVYQASYLAKISGKENRQSGTWLVSGTRSTM